MPDSPSSPIDRVRAALADRYVIGRELGHGAMATVYLARDVKHDRDVAVKVMRPELVAVLGATRFLQEIRIAAHLQHPHIVPLFDSGAAGDVLFYVMPYVEGESLRRRLDREMQLPLGEEAAYVFAESDAGLGRRAEAARLLADMVEASKSRYIGAEAIAAVYVRLGDANSAFRWLDSAVVARSAYVLSLKADRKWDPIRADPQFAALVQRIGLP